MRTRAHVGANVSLGCIGLGSAFGHDVPLRLLAMDAADFAIKAKPTLVRLAAVGHIVPDLGRGVIHTFPQSRSA